MTSTDCAGSRAENEDLKGRETVSVKDAARALGVRAWRIYRMNRTTGPLRFVQRGRSVLVESSSLHTYITELRRQEPRKDPSHGNRRALLDLSSGTECPDDDGAACERIHHSGQRELSQQQGRQPGIVMFISDWTPIPS